MRSTLAVALLIPLSVAGASAQSHGDASSAGPVATNARQSTSSSVTQQPTASETSLAKLRARLLERWRVIRTRDGIVLTPRRANADLQGIELTNDQIYVNGEPASGAELRARLGGDADAVLALSYLDAPTRASLFEPPKPSSAEAQTSTAVSTSTEPSRVVMRRHGARIRIGSDLYVSEQERIDEAAVAILGSANIDGEIGRDVVAIGGSIRLGPHAVVHGDVTSVGGRIQADPGARVLGKANEVAVAWPDQWGPVSIDPAFRTRIWPDWHRWATFAVVGVSFRLAVFVLLGLMVVLIGGRLYGHASDYAASAPWQSVIIGIGVQLVTLPVLIVICATLLVSIIGIPLLALVPLGLVVLGALGLIGFAAVSERVGRRVGGAVGASGLPPVAAFLVGFVLLTFLAWLARVAWWAGWIGGGTALLLAGVGAVIEGLAWAAGIGAIVLAWLGRGRPAAAMVAPPPLATAPMGPTGV